MKRTSILVALSLLALLLVHSGCVEQNGDGTSLSFTTIKISDAPSENFSHINVTFSQVKIHRKGNDTQSGWIIFDMEPKTIDMIYLHEHDLSEVLGTKDISTGNYSMLWIVVDSATGVLKETGEDITFQVPSGDLKIQQAFTIKEGDTTIDVEIDLDRSILYVPQGEIYKLLPVINRIKIEHGDGEIEEIEVGEEDF